MSDRNKRLIAVTRHLSQKARRQVSLTELSRLFGVAKSTLSEDLLLIKEALETYGLGHVESQVGVTGGVVFSPSLPKDELKAALAEWIQALTSPDRMTPDGFLYVTDLLFSPSRIDPMGLLLAERFRPLGINFVATVETRGIPLALACARELGVDMVLLRRDHRLSEGASLSINYLSGSSRRVQSMSLARRAPVRGGRILFVDDFMQAGGTARAAHDLLSDFGAQVVGAGVLIVTRAPDHKLVEEYAGILEWSRAEEGPGSVAPSHWVRELLDWEA
ncbi:pur operon repressor [Sulfobacillus acidophilus TPY]|jgi:purine operon repressor|uniref:Purine operon repressor, PurR n=1 Tax=Sulfobacillus acidophilus (strain ATCC 700253 / DSM 10332 / NAL) TaxID=679936 RepID=G8TW96_SULAD|nr:pur operon repressor [Sulfobacillus acidophilus TPY]AEW03739.1 purine operon repressor, PurR [Sulfobacillus acidophilus DSM 10332]MCY0865781.1 phosphoribosyltransferase family protein [Sulfobacillus sp.]